MESSTSPRLIRRTDDLFVGRLAELELLRGAVAACFRGRGGLWLISGEAGIGKTSLVAELARDGSDLDLHWGRCRESEGAPPFWPWIEVVREVKRALDPGVLRRCLGDGATDLAGLVPELRGETDASATLPPDLDGPAARFRLYDHFAAFLRRVSAEQPQMIVLDDLQWADRASLLLLQHLAVDLESVPILLLGTYRPVEAQQNGDLAEVLGDIARHAHNIPLDGLGRDDVAVYLKSALGSEVSTTHASSVHERTAGNALFVTEMARRLRRAPSDVAADDLPVSEGIRQVIHRRLDGLSAEAIGMLRVAALIGRAFDVQVLEPAWRKGYPNLQDGTELLDLVDQAIAACIVEPREVVGGYRFAHPLVRDAIESDLQASERASLHASIAGVIEELFGDRDAAIAELAHHWVGAAELGETRKAIDCARRAGALFRRQSAYDEAAAQYAAALRVLDLESGAGDERQRLRAELLLDLGRSQASISYEAGGREAFEEAAEIGRGLGDAEILAQSALEIVGAGSPGLGGDVGKARLIEEALEKLGPGDHPLRAMLLTRSLLPLYYSQDQDAVLRRSAEAVGIAERVCDDGTLGQVLGERIMVLYGPDHVEERERMALRILDLAKQSNRRRLYLHGHGWSVVNLLQLGRIEEARAHLDRQSAIAEEQRQPFERWRVSVCRAALALLAGSLREAEELASAAGELGAANGIPNAAVTLSIQIYRIRLEQGRLDELEPIIVDFGRSMAHIPAARGPLALAYGHIGRLEEARRAFAALASANFNDYPRDSNFLTGLTDAAHVAWFLDDRERAARLYEILAPCEELAVIGSWLAACSGVVGHYLGLLAAVLERWPQATRHFEAAAAMYERMGARPLLARLRLDHAEMSLRSGDGSTAETLLRPALAELAALNMASWHEHGERLLGRLAGRNSASAEEAGRGAVEKAVFKPEGDFWTLGFEGCMVRVKELKGLQILRTLLREPGREFHVADLSGSYLAPRGGRGCEPILDEQARLDYRRRAEALREMLDEAEQNNDRGRADAVRNELDELARQLVPSVVNASHRSRELENMRKAVGKNIRSVLMRIQAIHEPLWRHLSNAVHTGVLCSYRPDRSVEWIVD